MTFTIRPVKFESGERFFNLFNHNNEPMYWPTSWCLSELRGKNLSSSTIQAALTAIKYLYEFLDKNDINLESQVEQGKLLNLGQIGGLLDF